LKLGLPVTGKKDELIARLDAATLISPTEEKVVPNVSVPIKSAATPTVSSNNAIPAIVAPNKSTGSVPEKIEVKMTEEEKKRKRGSSNLVVILTFSRKIFGI
jgi:hypothetical protein